jgi:hypothetical protein
VNTHEVKNVKTETEKDFFYFNQACHSDNQYFILGMEHIHVLRGLDYEVIKDEGDYGGCDD